MTLLVGFLRVCPIQPHLCLLIWVLILSCSVPSYSSSFLMDLRHLLTKDCSFLEVSLVALHGSLLYSHLLSHLFPRSYQTGCITSQPRFPGHCLWYAIWTFYISILQMSHGSLDLLFTWSALIDLQGCVSGFYVGNLAQWWSVQQLPEVVCPPFSLLLLVGEQFSTLGSDRSVRDLFSTCQCSRDGIELFHITLACCFLRLICNTVYKVPSVFSNASFNLLVGFGVLV